MSTVRSSTTTMDWLRETIPSESIASKVACSRLHLKGVDEMSKLNASCYGVTGIEQYSNNSGKQMLHALEVATAAIGELRGRMATLEAESDGDKRRCEKAEARTHLVREEVESRARSEQAMLMQRIIVAETRAAAAERSAAEALAATRCGDIDGGLQKRVSIAEARLEMINSDISMRQQPQYTTEDARVERSMARAERESAAVRSALDELRSRLQRAEARADEEAARSDSTRERLARSEEQILSQRSVFDATLQETKLRIDDLLATVADERERAARTDQRLTGLEASTDDHSNVLTAKFEALNVEHNFGREHLARVEEKLYNVTTTESSSDSDRGAAPPYDEDDEEDEEEDARKKGHKNRASLSSSAARGRGGGPNLTLSPPPSQEGGGAFSSRSKRSSQQQPSTKTPKYRP